ncbi:hypothetical protein BX616_010844 [Lobosporangium transversale]|uniref:Uncharacterized protein n=1 Tax=Lobosporangium transversale TaxID=64571 RepID=A0A1Y2GUM2_9FUNG|nr:hypothetical protein BCR41DRAFT_394237 [Lobosporangium transversale]KAF9910485.1 hypothetical protein BX616_010844 [Lobosporangium transversale]ORZ23921.1 hypothetical protein BCR41DRAFT_394237 [Lobosporangium transversale]|eukprot:XP_021883735.1 hypothetical protein BCR41DRAFT_394237 [Lobosporangium transversale]
MSSPRRARYARQSKREDPDMTSYWQECPITILSAYPMGLKCTVIELRRLNDNDIQPQCPACKSVFSTKAPEYDTTLLQASQGLEGLEQRRAALLVLLNQGGFPPVLLLGEDGNIIDAMKILGLKHNTKDAKNKKQKSPTAPAEDACRAAATPDSPGKEAKAATHAAAQKPASS